MNESHLVPKDLKNASLAVYRERRKDTPVLPKTRDDVYTATGFMVIETNKSEKFLLANDREKGILLFSSHLNLVCLCNDMSSIFIDGTFMCCPKYFYHLYTLHGCKNGNYVPLMYALLPPKDEECYEIMWKMICDLCSQKQLSFVPNVIHIDFEQAMHTAIMHAFPQCKIDCCRFHLAQSWWRKIQTVGLSTDYKDKSTEIGKWLSQFFGLPFLPPNKVEDCFTFDIMSDAPSDDKCHTFLDYVLSTYICTTSRYPPQFWAAAPVENCKRTNNGPESFHSHYNEQFYSHHPNIYVFMDVIKKIQAVTYVKMRTLDMPASVRKPDKEKTDFVIDKYGRYRNDEITRKEYIRCVAYKYSARTDL
ncbi:uncharacterized protein [Mytilus edulis]|uniref:uncharacterized protein n=1 Tax=Mytilus edulis TaxID=6550 RepID=UPI0039F0F239